MKTSKTFKVIMLSTEKASTIHLWLENKLERCELEYSHTRNAQHLYIISDDEIKEGDYYVIGTNILRATCDSGDRKEACKKIVATTDKLASGKCMEERCLLHPCDGKCCLDQLNEQFIQVYIKAYNEGKPITEVDLEIIDILNYKEIDNNREFTLKEHKIKTRPDNTVIVHQSKLYTRDEVIDLISRALEDTDEIGRLMNFNEWVQDNL